MASSTRVSVTSAQAAQLLEEIRELMQLKGENVFKIRAFDKASEIIAGLETARLHEAVAEGRLTEIPGIGKGIAEVLSEYVKTGKSAVKAEIEASLPEGLLELTQVPGLGPKKAMAIIEELEIRTLRELEYACRENRLLKLKGFGEKVQAKILEGVHFLNANSGQLRLGDVFDSAERLFRLLGTELAEIDPELRVSEAGELRRRMEVLSSLDFVVEVPGGKGREQVLSRLEGVVEKFRKDAGLGIPVRLQGAASPQWGTELARLSGTEPHWKALGVSADALPEAGTEQEVYEKLRVEWIAPELRETGEEVKLARSKGGLESKVLPWNGVRGIFHNHTTRSDGTATLEEMVVAAKERGYSYIGISDHSQSAFYAHGLKKEDLEAQEKEVRTIQEKHPEIRIFWGIESDILADGALDYDDRQLARFDFVIASIHSRFGMDERQMTDRIVRAIRNPATRFIGHLTGRLLLGRKGYALDMERVIREAAAHDVAIEINAHPARLDIDWRMGPQLREAGTRVSINPDAHAIEGLDDVRYGVAVARKALLPPSLVVNAGGANEVAKWLARG